MVGIKDTDMPSELPRLTNIICSRTAPHIRQFSQSDTDISKVKVLGKVLKNDKPNVEEFPSFHLALARAARSFIFNK